MYRCASSAIAAANTCSAAAICFVYLLAMVGRPGPGAVPVPRYAFNRAMRAPKLSVMLSPFIVGTGF